MAQQAPGLLVIISIKVTLDQGTHSESYNISYTKYGLFAKSKLKNSTLFMLQLGPEKVFNKCRTIRLGFHSNSSFPVVCHSISNHWVASLYTRYQPVYHIYIRTCCCCCCCFFVPSQMSDLQWCNLWNTRIGIGSIKFKNIYLNLIYFIVTYLICKNSVNLLQSK